MKFFIVLSCVFVLSHGVSEKYKTDINSRMMDVAAICIPEVGANEGDISELMARKQPSRKEGKCLMSCFEKKFGLQGEDGKPNKEGVLALLEPLHDDDPDMYTKLIKVALTCGPEVSNSPLTDHCDIAVEIAVCALREGKLVGVDDPFSLQG